MEPKNYPEPPVEPEDDVNFPRCPWCGEDCDTIYVDRFGRVVGCGGCIETKDAWANRHLTE